MTQLLLFLTMGVGYLGGMSVSFTKRAEAIWSNPAGLAFHSKWAELRLNGASVPNSNFAYRLGISAGVFGFGYYPGDSTGNFSAGIGIPLGKRYRIGGAYSWGEQKHWSFGFEGNPFNWLAVGGMLKTTDTISLNFGLGVRPFTDRVTVFSDLGYKGGLKSLKFGLGVEPISGVVLSGSLTQPLDGNGHLAWAGGLELAIANVKLGASYNSDKVVGIGLGISLPSYPGIDFSKHGPKVIEFIPKGRPESGKSPLFKFLNVSVGGSSKTFYSILADLRGLGEQNDVKGILLDFRKASYSSYQMEELRSELARLKKAGVKIIAFGEDFSISSIYLASVADKVYLVPTGNVSFASGYVRTLHIKKALNKLGIEPQFYRVGEYKSAYELFEFSETSDENKEQLKAYLSSLYDELLNTIAKARNIQRTELEKMMKERVIFNADTAKALRLIDGLCQAVELDSIVKLEFGENASRVEFSKHKEHIEGVPRAWVKDDRKSNAGFKKGSIAIVVAEGSIVTGESSVNPIPIPLLGGKQVGSTTIAEALEKIRKDDDIKAVVFRINSGGGSALASEIMNRALTNLAKEKPVIVSMAGMAASGGYYISAPAKKIYADATTLTGSIGILGGKFVSKGFDEKLGITRETVKLYPHADMFSPDRPFDEKEAKLMQGLMDEGYAEFVNRVAEGREMSFKEVDKVARGRIWSGPDGVRVGLVDEIGGIMDAVDEARKMAELGADCKVEFYPEPTPLIDVKNEPEASILETVSLKNLPSWLQEHMLYMLPYQIEISTN